MNWTTEGVDTPIFSTTPVTGLIVEQRVYIYATYVIPAAWFWLYNIVLKSEALL